jgi:hypothetical protein
MACCHGIQIGSLYRSLVGLILMMLRAGKGATTSASLSFTTLRHEGGKTEVKGMQILGIGFAVLSMK